MAPDPSTVKQPTRGERADRTRFMRECLEKFTKWGIIKAAFKQRYGVGPRTCEKYRRRARAEMIAESKRPPEEHRAEALMLPYQIRADVTESTSDRLRANTQIVDMLGLAIREVKHTGGIGVEHTGSVQTEFLTKLRIELLGNAPLLSELRTQAAKMADPADGQPETGVKPPDSTDAGDVPAV